VAGRESFSFTRAEMAAAGSAAFDPPIPGGGVAGTDYIMPVLLVSTDDGGNVEPLASQALDATVAGDELTVTAELAHFSEHEAQLADWGVWQGEFSELVGNSVVVSIWFSPAAGQYLQLEQASFFAQPPAITSVLQEALPVAVPPATAVAVLQTCNETAEGLWFSVLSGTINVVALPPRTTRKPPTDAKPPACDEGVTTLDEGEALDIPAIPVTNVTATSATSPQKVCGNVGSGGADETGEWTYLLGQVGVFLIHIDSAGTLHVSLDWDDDAADLDYFIATLDVADVRDVGDAAILERFNGIARPETGTVALSPGDYLMWVHRFDDGAASWVLDLWLETP
jgi:hypothetical protein